MNASTTVLEQLVNLHRVDSQLRGLRVRLDAADRHLATQDRHLGAIRHQIDELLSQRKQLQAKVGNLEVEAKAMDERVERLRSELNSQQTHKAYTAIQSELNNLKSDRTNVDGRTLGEMELIERLGAEAAKLELAAAERLKLRDHAAKEFEERRSEVGERLAQLTRERDEAAAAIPEATRELFNRIAKMYSGEALAAVEEVDRRSKEYACTACNVHLPFELISRLLSPGGAVVQCQGCRRILYLQQETRTAITKSSPASK